MHEDTKEQIWKEKNKFAEKIDNKWKTDKYKDK